MHILIYTSITALSVVLLNPVFASDFKITTNVICQLTDTCVSKPSPHSSFPGQWEKGHSGQGRAQKEPLPFVPLGMSSWAHTQAKEKAEWNNDSLSPHLTQKTS